MLKVFVYGTLKPGEINYKRYCLGKVVKQIKVWTKGQLYHLPYLGYPGMVSCKTGRVEGYLLLFNQANMLNILDELEDYHPRRSPWQNEYNRHPISVYWWDTQPEITQAWAYSMSIEQVQQRNGVLIASGWWNSRSIKW